MDFLHNRLMEKGGVYSKWHSGRTSNFLHWITFVTVLYVAVSNIYSAYAVNNDIDFNQPETASESILEGFSYSPNSLPEATSELLNLSRQLKNAVQEDRPALLQSITELATARKKSYMEALINDPTLALNVSLPTKLKDGLPNEVKWAVEESKEIRGVLEWTHEDFFDQQSTIDTYSVIEKGSNKKYQIKLAKGEIGKIPPGSSIRVKGYLLDNQVVTDSQNITATSLVNDVITKSRKVAVILFNWQNDNRTPFTADQAREYVFTGSNSSNTFFNENSFGQLEIVGKTRTDGEVFGWYTIPYDNTNCATNHANVWSLAARALAQADGFDQLGYDGIVYMFPSISCGWSGTATIGNPPTYAAINGGGQSTIIHEIGHNIGSHHASSLNCTENGTRVSISGNSSNCTTNEYGDPFSVMGISGGYKHLNNYEKGTTLFDLNWLNHANTITVDRNSMPDNVYTVQPIEKFSSSTQSIRIPRVLSSSDPVSEYYYIEFRQPFGFDNFTSSDPVVNGVSIRLAPDHSIINKSKLVDTTPETGTFYDSALSIGKTFTDSTYGINITTQAINQNEATVRINYGTPPCVPNNPSINITPTTQNGAPGQTLNYSLTLTNNESSSCPQAQYSITPTLPSGWTQVPTSFMENLSPGSNITRTFSITSLNNSSAGNYTINQSAVNTANTTLSSSANTMYVVQVPDTTAPTVTITKPANNSTIPTKGKLDIAVTASDDRTVTNIQIFFDNNLIKSCLNSTSCVYSYTATKASRGTHTVMAKAFDAAGNTTTATVNVIK